MPIKKETLRVYLAEAKKAIESCEQQIDINSPQSLSHAEKCLFMAIDTLKDTDVFLRRYIKEQPKQFHKVVDGGWLQCNLSHVDSNSITKKQ